MADQDCSATLLPRITEVKTDDITYVALAYNLSEGAWENEKLTHGTKAIVYGIPIDTSWERYHAKAQQKAESLGYQHFEQHAYAYATSGLDDTNLKIYRECIAGNQGGWSLALNHRGTAFYKLILTSRPPDNVQHGLRAKIRQHPNIVKGDVREVGRDLATFEADRGGDKEFFVTPQNPNKEAGFSVQIGNKTVAIILPPIVDLKPEPVPAKKSVEGTYYMYGDEHRPCFVAATGDHFTFTNEYNQAVPGTVASGQVTAPPWPAGTIGRDDSWILWSNWTLWSKVKTTIGNVANGLSTGKWSYLGRDVTVKKQGDTLYATNERGDTTTLVNRDPLHWQAPAWGNLTAIVTPDLNEIHWANNSTWLRPAAALMHLRPSVRRGSSQRKTAGKAKRGK
jgi:hypothetical protein